MRAVRYPTPPEPHLELDLERRPRLHPALPVIDARSFAPAQGGFEPRMARAEASRCFRCDAVEGCASVHVAAGRGPDDRPGIGMRRPVNGNENQQPTMTGGVA